MDKSLKVILIVFFLAFALFLTWMFIYVTPHERDIRLGTYNEGVSYYEDADYVNCIRTLMKLSSDYRDSRQYIENSLEELGKLQDRR